MSRPPSPTLIAAAALLIVACHGPADPQSPGSAASAASTDRILRDGLQRDVRLPVSARRVVSLAPSITDSLLALGLGARLVGVSEFCRLPPGFPAVTRIGGLVNPNLEAIRSLHPDLLLGTTSGNGPELVGQADALGVPLFIVHTPTIDSMMESLMALADALGERTRGESLVAELQGRLRQVAARVTGLPRPRVLFVVWGDPLVVPGAASFLTDAIARAGGVSVTADAPAAHPAFSLEAAISRAPEVILLTPDNTDVAQRWRADPVWAGVPAIRSGRIHVVAEGVVQPGPGVVSGVEEMARLLHPEAYCAAPPAGRSGAPKKVSRAGTMPARPGDRGGKHPSAPPPERLELCPESHPGPFLAANQCCMNAAAVDRLSSDRPGSEALIMPACCKTFRWRASWPCCISRLRGFSQSSSCRVSAPLRRRPLPAAISDLHSSDWS